MLLLRSGTGLIGLAFLGTLKLISYNKTQKSWKSRALTLVLLPALYIGVSYYVSTEIGSGMLKRQNELTDQSGSSYDRIFRGLELYDAMPLPNKIIGIETQEREQPPINPHRKKRKAEHGPHHQRKGAVPPPRHRVEMKQKRKNEQRERKSQHNKTDIVGKKRRGRGRG